MIVEKIDELHLLLNRVCREINEAEETKSPYAYMEARRILNNEVRLAVEQIKICWLMDNSRLSELTRMVRDGSNDKE